MEWVSFEFTVPHEYLSLYSTVVDTVVNTCFTPGGGMSLLQAAVFNWRHKAPLPVFFWSKG